MIVGLDCPPARYFALFCFAVTLSFMDWSAEATLGGNGMVAGFKGCDTTCVVICPLLMFSISLGIGWFGKVRLVGEPTEVC